MEIIITLLVFAVLIVVVVETMQKMRAEPKIETEGQKCVEKKSRFMKTHKRLTLLGKASKIVFILCVVVAAVSLVAWISGESAAPLVVSLACAVSSGIGTVLWVAVADIYGATVLKC